MSNLYVSHHMKKSISLLFLFLLTSLMLIFTSCREDFDSVPSEGNLVFSKDTLFLDTVFSNTSSSTYQFKVYNKSNSTVNIPKIELGQGDDSFFRLNVDGLPGKKFNGIEILPRDSIFVFVEVTADVEALSNEEVQFIYEDEVLFDTETNQQQVNLVALIQDAVFLFPERFEDGSKESLLLGVNEDDEEIRIEGFFLDDENLHFTNEKPYVIYGFAGVPSGKTLKIDPGARLHFHANSGIIVANNASLQAEGELSTDQNLLENEIIFQGDRLEPSFANVPGQWAAVWLTSGSTNHIFNHVTIKNSTVGILMDFNDGGEEPTLNIKNTQIYNAATVGLLARTGNVDAENLVVNNCGQASINLSYGGKYNFRHCTIANYWNNSFRQFPALLIENSIQTPNGVLVEDLVEANFSNCIIYGSENIELILNRAEGAAFNYSFKNSLLRFNDFNNSFVDNPIYDFEDESLFQSLVLNQNPLFFNPNANNFRIELDSGASIIGDDEATNLVPFDLLGNARMNPSDAGAYNASEMQQD